MWMKLQELMAEREIYPRLQGYRSDLEVAPITTILPIFAPEIVSTCFFHLAQAYWRKIQNLGLMDLYRKNEAYSMLLRSFTALAFVPEHRVVEHFNHLSRSIPEDAPPTVLSFMEYIASTNVGQEVDDRRIENADDLVLTIRRIPRWKEPKFSPRIWSVYERVLNDEPRTTNMLEGWHIRFNTLVARSHPNIFDFISRLRSEQARTDALISKLVMGEAPKFTRRNVLSKNQRIKNVVQQFDRREPLVYLRGIAHNIKFSTIDSN